MPERKEKKLIMVPSDLANQLLEMAGRQGKPFSSFLQGHLEQVVRVGRIGAVPLKDIVDFFEIMESLKSAGATFAPPEVMRFLIEEVYPKGRERLQGKWYESGEWYGKYLTAKFPDRLDALERLLRASRWDLDELNVTRKTNGVEIRCISTNLSLEETDLLLRFIEGAMRSLGYEAKKGDYSRGIISLGFEQTDAARA